MGAGQASIASAGEPVGRDYSLTGERAKQAVRLGLADAEWYRPPIDPARLRELMTRRNGPAIRDTFLWLALLGGTGVLAYVALGTWWAIPAFALYGALYGGSADPRWHENGHGTAFRTRWPNDVVYNFASFLLLREPTLWRWSHVRHHSDTIIVGRDPEISFPRPFRFRMVLPNYLHLLNGPKMVWRIVQHAAGKVDEDTREFVPEEEMPRVVREARIFVAILSAVVVWCVVARSIVPLLFIGLPSFYGVWLVWFFAITQHAGLNEDVLDHRYSTRTVYMNPVFRFLYLNMNYHLEHHLFPSVPYHALPALHAEVKQFLPAPKTSMFDAYKEIVHALLKQRRNPDWEIPGREVPDDAGYRLTATRISSASLATSMAVAAGLESRTDLGPADLVMPGQVKRIDIDEHTYALYRTRRNHYALTDGLCTHGQTHLADGHLDEGIIECPKHNGRFNIVSGEPVRRPAKLPLATYPVQVVDGRLLVALRRNAKAKAAAAGAS
jgi:Na+-transporting NADH:ubiquinone oxidoreductase subunit F